MKYTPVLILLLVITISVSVEGRKRSSTSSLLRKTRDAPPRSQTRGVNLALGGEATQIDTHPLGDASHAIDGRRNSVYWDGSCSHTSTHNKAWWRLDLQDTYLITSITITNRRDCCAHRLVGAEIHVGNSLERNGNGNPLVATITGIPPPGRSQTFDLPGHPQGRYVNVFQPNGPHKYLTLCEVEVYGYQDEKQNVALGGFATQIDTFEHGAASNAIDGNRDSVYSHNSCSHTLTTTNPWWRVDLRNTFSITSITIKNRGDCCAQRLDGAEIRVGSSLQNNGNDNPVVARISHIRSGLSQTFTLSTPVEGRYVNVYLPGTDKYLTLCEVEVNGLEVDTGESPDASK